MLALAACAGIGEPSDPTRNWSEAKLYQEARASLDDGDYEEAVDYYGKLGARFPFGTHAAQGQIDLMYAYFKSGDPDSAIEEADRFIRLEPDHPGVEYAYYIKGLTDYRRRYGWWLRFMRAERAERDLAYAEASFAAFKALLERFPDTRYGDDARERLHELREAFARRELMVAEFYAGRKAWVAAANRAEHLVHHFPSSASVVPALALMTRAYRSMGLDELADDSLRVLRANAPDHPEPGAAATTAGGSAPRTGVLSRWLSRRSARG